MPIIFEDLVAYKQILAGIAKLEKANEQWADSAVKQNQRIAESMAKLKAEAAGLKDQIEAYKSAKSGGAGLAGFPEAFDRVKKANDSLNQVLQRNQQQIDLNTASVTAIKKRLADLATEYNNLDRAEAQNLRRQQQIVQERKLLASTVVTLTKANRDAAKSVDAAENSYRSLDQQTSKLRTDLKALQDGFDPLTGEINQHNRAAVDMQRQIEKNSKALATADRAMGQYQRNVGNYGSAFKGLAGDLTGFTSVAGGVGIAIGAIGNALGTMTEMDRVNASLRAVSKDSEDFSRSQQFLMSQADKLGLRYDTLVDSYKSLKAATKNTGLEGRSTEKIFSAVAGAGAKLKLSNETVTGTFNALQQMISKGKIQAEELRGQLGERLVGSLRLMSEALGVSETKLNKMMEQGELLAVDVLPKFADALKNAYPVDQEERISGITAETNRLKNEYSQLLDTFNQKSKVTDNLSNFIGALNNSLRAIKLFVRDGSFKEFLTFFGPDSFTGRTQRSLAKDEAVASLGAMKPEDRKKALQRQQTQEDFLIQKKNSGRGRFDLFKTNETELRKAFEVRQAMQAEFNRLEKEDVVEGERALTYSKKKAVEANETDLLRFRKLAVKKRMAEIIALEKTATTDGTAAAKLEVYTKIDSELRGKDQAVSNRIKSLKPAKVNDDTELEKLDKQIKKIVATLETQAMQDLKAGRIVSLDPALIKQLDTLRAKYKSLGDIKEALEKGTYNKALYQTGPLKDVDTITSTSEVFTGKTGKGSQVAKGTTALSNEKLKELDRQRLADLTETLGKQAGIQQEYSIRRNGLETEFSKTLTDARRGQYNELVDLLTQMEDAEKAGDTKRLENLRLLYGQKKDLYKKDVDVETEVRQKAGEVWREAAKELANGLFEIQINNTQRRMESLDKQKEAEINNSDQSESTKAAIEKKYDEQHKQLQRQQDEDRRNQSLFNIAVSGVEAIAKTFSQFGFVAGLPLAAAQAGLTAVQLGVVAAQKLPEYKDGKGLDGLDTYAGPAIAGEAGRELWFHDGKAEMVDKPSLINVGRKDVILPNPLTELVFKDPHFFDSHRTGMHLAESERTRQNIINGRAGLQADMMAKALSTSFINSPSANAKALAGELAKLPFQHFTFDARGFTQYVRTVNSQVTEHQRRTSFPSPGTKSAHS